MSSSRKSSELPPGSIFGTSTVVTMESASQIPVTADHHVSKIISITPSYNEVVEIDNPSAPSLHQTFPGSIFGTSTVATMEMASQSFPVSYSDCGNVPTCRDYSFVIRDFLGSVQAKGNVSNLSTTLENVNGSEILRIRSLSEPTMEPLLSKIGEMCTFERKSVTHTFELFKNKVPIGLVKYDKKEFADECLKIHSGNANDEMVIKSLSLGDFAIFRDHLSTTPICNIQIPNATYNLTSRSFDAKIIFHQDTGITAEEQLLCTAAAISIEVTTTHLSVMRQIDSKHREILYGIIVMIVVVVILFLTPIFLKI